MVVEPSTGLAGQRFLERLAQIIDAETVPVAQHLLALTARLAPLELLLVRERLLHHGP